MMMGRKNYHLAIIGLTCLLALSIVGCASTEPSRFYILDTIDRVSDGESDLSIGVGPVGIPEHLDRPQIVIRVSPNKLELSDFDKWAGSLRDNISQVLSENLSRLLSTDRVSTYPWQTNQAIDYKVTVEILPYRADHQGYKPVNRNFKNVEIRHLHQPFIETKQVKERGEKNEKNHPSVIAAIGSADSRAGFRRRFDYLSKQIPNCRTDGNGQIQLLPMGKKTDRV